MQEVLDIIKKYKSFALFCHIGPDADALGSMNAFKMALKKLGKKVFIYCDCKVPKYLSFLKVKLDTKASYIAKCDACIMMDCNSLDRLGKYGEYFDKAPIRGNIDHHQKMDYVFDFAYTDTKSPSTSDLVYEIIKNLDVTINSDIALNLYAGLASDTGCFQHPGTNQGSHKHAYELINYNFDLREVNYKLFKEKPKNYLYFYKTALRNTKPYLNEKLYVIYFNNRAYKKFKHICDNSAAFQFLDGIAGNEIRVKIIEKQKGFYTLSFRSNKYADVCSVAKQFDGGGHKMASGGKATGSYKEILSKIITYCKEELDRYPEKEKQLEAELLEEEIEE